MPNGYRRGGHYKTRSGATAYRRGTKIAAPKGLMVVAGGLIGLSVFTGGSLVGSPVLIALAGTAVVGLGVWRFRRQLKPVGRRMVRWADKRSAGHGQRATLAARTKPRQPLKPGVAGQRIGLVGCWGGLAGMGSAVAFGTGGFGLFAAGAFAGGVCLFASRLKTAQDERESR